MNIAILLAAGKSKRFGSDKTLVEILGKPVFAHSLALLEASPFIHEIFVAVHAGNEKKIKHFIAHGAFKKIKKVFRGGRMRFQSVRRAISQATKADVFVIHNAANPLAIENELVRCFRALKKGINGVAVGRKITSTIKRIAGILETIPRENLWEVETPQVVRAKEFLEACRRFPSGDFTDDLAVLEKAGFQTAIVSASPHNRKLTTQQDFEILKFFAGDIPKNFSIGIGEDSHRFEKKSKCKIPRNDPGIQIPNSKPPVTLSLSKGDNARNCLTLGGIKVPYLPALAAESDGDAMIHALCNAIASARGKGSLGTYATKFCKKGMRDSRIYLKKILSSHKILSVSFSFEGSKPKIDPLTSRLKQNLSHLLNIAPCKIGITATSGENLTPFGRGEALKCTAQVLLCAK